MNSSVMKTKLFHKSSITKVMKGHIDLLTDFDKKKKKIYRCY